MLVCNTTLRRPRTLFSIALVTLCVTLLFSYERIRSSAFSLFHEPLVLDDPLQTLSDNQQDPYHAIFDHIPPMSYGTAHRPPMKGLPKNIIADLPDQLVPAISQNDKGHVKRLVIIGDVHGHKTALQELLDTLHFDPSHDSLVFTGDLINKGPDSAGVVELAMQLGALSVRGNHEDRILLTRAAMDSPRSSASNDTDLAVAAFDKFHIRDDGEDAGKNRTAALEEYQEGEDALSKSDKRAREVARSLSREQIKWLSKLPVILRVGSVPRGADQPDFENLLVVHAGLVPNVALDDQDPWAVMNMRTISYPITELRRDAVRTFLTERVKRLGSNRGMVAALQNIDDAVVDQELQKILESQESKHRTGDEDVALPSSGRDGKPWYEEWSAWQEKLVKQDRKKGKKGKKGEKHDKEDEHAHTITTVVYGHDAKSRLRVPKEYGKGKKGYTFGLDSGCVYGGQLSALVIEVNKDKAVHKLVQVDCAQHVAVDE